MLIDSDNGRPITAAAHHLHSGMICDGSLKKTFAGLLQILVFPWVPECFVEVGTAIDRAITCTCTQIITNIIIV